MTDTGQAAEDIDSAPTDQQPSPWRRFLARSFDLWIGGTVFWFAVSYGTYLISPDLGDRFTVLLSTLPLRMLDGMILLAVMVPIGAAMVGALGFSPGKWLCRIKVRDKLGQRIGFSRAFRREIGVWTSGYGLGVPLVSLFCLFRAYSDLNETGTTSWDRAQDLKVVQGSLDGPRVLGVMLCMVVVVGGVLWNINTRVQALGAGY